MFYYCRALHVLMLHGCVSDISSQTLGCTDIIIVYYMCYHRQRLPVTYVVNVRGTNIFEVYYMWKSCMEMFNYK